jgi:hypothetical protein
MLKDILISYPWQRLRSNILGFKHLPAVITPEVTPLSQEVMSRCVTLCDREKALDLIPKGGVCAEVGTAYGEFSRVILKNLGPSVFHAIDTFNIVAGREPWGLTILAEHKMTHEEYYAEKFLSLINSKKLIMHKGLSWEVLATFEDNTFDYLYLDAGHDYKSVKKDIDALNAKMKPNSFIQFNDYTIYDFFAGTQYGVIQAVNEFIMSGKHEMIAFCLNSHGFHDVLVQIKK